MFGAFYKLTWYYLLVEREGILEIVGSGFIAMQRGSDAII